MTITYLTGDALDTLRTLPAGAFRCCVTSPPYYGLRSYLPAEHPDKPREIGLEATPDEYIAALVAVFREARRCLTDDGTLWVNIGDSYSGGVAGRNDMDDQTLARRAAQFGTGRGPAAGPREKAKPRPVPAGYKPKDLLGIPWLLAFALRADGWYLRRDIIWHKPNPMPESVRDRPTSAHEYVFLMAKSERYYYDAAAVAEPATHAGEQLGICRTVKKRAEAMGRTPSGNEAAGADAKISPTRNRRSVWTIATEPCGIAHFAVMPNALAELCILAGSAVGDRVLDPFGGAGTTGLVAERLNRHSTLIDLDPRNRARLWGGDTPLLAGAAS